MRRGHEILPVADATIRFWVSRLHGPEILQRDISRAISAASQRLMAGDEFAAQRTLDALDLTEFSQDGAWLCQEIAAYLRVPAPNMPVRSTLQTWNAQDIALHLSIFKLNADTSRVLAKGIVPFDPVKHPHWEAGTPDRKGGQFRPADASDATIVPVALRPRRPRRLPPAGLEEHSSEPTRGIGDNSGKFPELDVPPQAPPPEDRYGTVTQIAQDLEEAVAAGATAWTNQVLLRLATMAWMTQAATNYYYQIRANLDPPETLEQLQNAVNKPTLGYQIHHIVEWNGSDNEFSEEQLESSENLVRIPEIKHRQITNWYQTRTSEFGGLSPRDYLEGKDWDAQWKVGIAALIKFKVLKP